jgi:hypothetical protein
MIDDFYTNPDIIMTQYVQGFASMADQDLDAIAQAGGGGASTGTQNSPGDGGGDIGPLCFLGNTRVLLRDLKKSRPISEIVRGDSVAAFDLKGRVYAAKVLDVYKHFVTEFQHTEFTNGTVICCTSTHPFWQGGEVFTAIGAATRARLYDPVEGWLDLQILRRVKVKAAKPIAVFNLEVKKYKTYIADGFGVHNRKREE